MLYLFELERTTLILRHVNYQVEDGVLDQIDDTSQQTVELSDFSAQHVITWVERTKVTASPVKILRHDNLGELSPDWRAATAENQANCIRRAVLESPHWCGKEINTIVNYALHLNCLWIVS